MTQNQRTDFLRQPFQVLLALLLITVPLAAQQTSSAQPTARFEEEMQVTEVFLDVLVLDEDEKPVTGLTAEDFRVTENGQPVELTSVEFYTTRYGGQEAASLPDNSVPASRYFVFFFVDQQRHASIGNHLTRRQIQAGRQARSWVEENLGGSDWVAVAGFTSHLEIYLDFSQNRGAIAEAITDASMGRRGLQDWPGRLQPEDPTAPSLVAALPSTKKMHRSTPTVYDALRVLAESLGGIVGRKIVLFYGIGFGEIDPTTGFALPSRVEYPALEDALNTNNVAVYPLDLTAVGTQHAQSNFLNTLAADTGGEYFPVSMSFDISLDRIERQNTAYYLLTYRSEHPADKSGFQEVEVEVPGTDYKVLARQGYHFGVPRSESR